MTLLAYAVARDADPFRGPLPPGLGGVPLFVLTDGGVGFVCGEIETAGPPTADRLVAYAAAVDALHRLGTVLPLRYGAIGDADRLRAKLRERRSALAADLAWVDGREEMSVRLALPPEPEPPPPEPAPTSPGLAYLRARRRRYGDLDRRKEAAARAVADVRAVLAGRFAEVAVDRPAAGLPGDVAVHFLVPRGTGPAFAAAVRAADLPADRWVSGPWPPYHFAGPPAAGGPAG